jgi:hypothetical protein
MDVEIVRFEEFPDWDVIKRAMVTKKRVVYTVNGSEHSLVISMEDYRAGKTKQLVDEEVRKISSVFEIGTVGTKKK